MADTVCAQREQALAEGMRGLASELRLIDAVDLVAYIRFDKLAHLEHLINSAAELHFAPGAVSFGSAAEVDLTWTSPPRFSFDMAFNTRDVKVSFSLVLEAAQAGVDIYAISFRDPHLDAAVNTDRLIAALDTACGPAARAAHSHVHDDVSRAQH